jgi:glycosyltransferase involved in cell wall biosynthesis
VRSVSHRRPTVCLVAFSCEPGRGSEPGAGWEFVSAAHSVADEWGWNLAVATRRGCETQILDRLRADGAADVELICEPHWLADRFPNKANRLYYAMWSLWLTRALRNKAFRVVHHVTYATEMIPPVEFVGMPKGTLKIWGPVGSSQVAESGARGLVIRCTRSWLSKISQNFVRRWVNVVLVQSASVSTRYATHSDVRVEPNVAVSTILHEIMGSVEPERIFDRQLCAVGVLTGRKRVDAAVQALKHVSDPSVGLVVVGDGNERTRLEELARGLGLQQRVRFLGNVERAQAVAVMLGSDALIHCSVREGAPWAVGEALTVGLPVVSIQGGGADELVSVSGGEGLAVAPGPDLHRRLGVAMTSLLDADLSGRPSERLLANRLPGLLSELYNESPQTTSSTD